MKLFSKVILFALFVSFPLSSWAYGDRFVKFVAQGDLALYGHSSFDVGLGVNFGKSDSKINLQATINYGQFTTSEESEEDGSVSMETGVGVMYHRVSVPVELYYMINGGYFVGAGVVYNHNLSGRIFEVSNTENYAPLSDGLYPHNLVARISAGATFMEYVGVKGFFDYNITPHLKKYSISDRLFEYMGPIEDSFTRFTLGVSLFLTF